MGESMRLLFDMDLKDYDDCTHTFVRNSARSIIVRDGKLAMIHSKEYDYYKFPGGGIEGTENPIDAMIRETREEAGLVVLPESVREYGYVHRIQRSDGDKTECFVQDNYYYLCDTDGTPVSQQLDEYEEKESYELEYVDPAAVIVKNRSVGKSPYNTMMFEREARVVELLIAEGVLPHR
jgi:8-oxo-dGTP pyrophosphatase MutT (NUDIX family)